MSGVAWDAIRLEVYYSAAWHTLADVGPELSCKWGIAGVGPADRVASTGTLEFWLDNSARNSAGTQFYYTTGGPYAPAWWTFGLPVRLVIVYAGVTQYPWYGYVNDCQPTPGAKSDQRVRVTCVDWMEFAATTFVPRLPVQTNKRADELVVAIMNNIETYYTPLPPGGTIAGGSGTTGSEVYPYALDSPGDTTILSEFQRIAASEQGLIFCQYGKVQFYSRELETMPWAPGSVFTLTASDEVEIANSAARGNLVHECRVAMRPRRIDSSDQVLFRQDSSQATQVLRGVPLTITATYRDPAGRATRVAGTGMQTPALYTDLTVNERADGTGADLTGYCSISATFYANQADVVITNAGPLDGYITTLTLRGRGLYDYEPLELVALAQPTGLQEGKNVVKLELPYQVDANKAQGFAEFICYMRGNDETGLPRRPRIDAVSFVANKSDYLMSGALAVGIGSRVAVVDPASGWIAATDHFVRSVAYTIKDKILRCTLTLVRADAAHYWTVEDATYGAIDENPLAFM